MLTETDNILNKSEILCKTIMKKAPSHILSMINAHWEKTISWYLSQKQYLFTTPLHNSTSNANEQMQKNGKKII